LVEDSRVFEVYGGTFKIDVKTRKKCEIIVCIYESYNWEYKRREYNGAIIFLSR